MKSTSSYSLFDPTFNDRFRSFMKETLSKPFSYFSKNAPWLPKKTVQFNPVVDVVVYDPKGCLQTSREKKTVRMNPLAKEFVYNPNSCITELRSSHTRYPAHHLISVWNKKVRPLRDEINAVRQENGIHPLEKVKVVFQNRICQMIWDGYCGFLDFITGGAETDQKGYLTSLPPSLDPFRFPESIGRLGISVELVSTA